MDDLISRQAAITALSNEIVKRRLLDEMYDGCIDEFQTEEILKKLPPANNSEIPNSSDIIHCKDCKYFKQVFAPNDNDGLCGHWHSKCDARTSQNGYCSHAERREVTE